MKIYRFFAFALLCISFSSISAPASNESLEKLFELTRMNEFMDTAYKRVDNMFAQQFAGQQISEPQRQVIGKYLLELSAMVRKDLAWDLLKGPIMEKYSQTYTEQEVQALNTFYASPIGQKVLKETPLLMQQTREIMQTSMKALEPRLQLVQKKLQQELASLPAQ